MARVREQKELQFYFIFLLEIIFFFKKVLSQTQCLGKISRSARIDAHWALSAAAAERTLSGE